MIPIAPLIAAFFTKTLEAKIPGTKNTVGEFTNKTNGWATIVIAFSITQLTQTPDSKMYVFLIVFSGFMVTIRHTITKIATILVELKKKTP